MNNTLCGFNIYSKPVEDILDYAIDHNLKHIEIHPAKDHSSVDSFTEERVEKLLSVTTANEVSLSMHIPHNLNIADIILPIRRKHIQQLTEYIDLASRLKANYITLHIGSFFWFPLERKMRINALGRFVKNIIPLLEKCEKHNVKIALENSVPIPHGTEYYFLGDNIEDFEFLFDKLKTQLVGFCLDTGHANMAEGVDKYLEKFGNRLLTVHYHDNNKKNDEHLPIGMGNIDWKKFARQISHYKFTGPFVSECRDQLPHESANLLNSIL